MLLVLYPAIEQVLAPLPGVPLAASAPAATLLPPCPPNVAEKLFRGLLGKKKGADRNKPHLATDEPVWRYRDPQGDVQGPFPPSSMIGWLAAGYLAPDLPVCAASRKVSAPDVPPASLYRPLRQLLLLATRNGGVDVPRPVSVEDVRAAIAAGETGKVTAGTTATAAPAKAAAATAGAAATAAPSSSRDSREPRPPRVYTTPHPAVRHVVAVAFAKAQGLEPPPKPERGPMRERDRSKGKRGGGKKRGGGGGDGNALAPAVERLTVSGGGGGCGKNEQQPAAKSSAAAATAPVAAAASDSSGSKKIAPAGAAPGLAAALPRPAAAPSSTPSPAAAAAPRPGSSSSSSVPKPKPDGGFLSAAASFFGFKKG